MHNINVRLYCEVGDHLTDGWRANGQSLTDHIGRNNGMRTMATCRGGMLVSFNVLLKRIASNQVLDLAEITRNPNAKTGSEWTDFDINTTASANIELIPDFSDLATSICLMFGSWWSQTDHG